MWILDILDLNRFIRTDLIIKIGTDFVASLSFTTATRQNWDAVYCYIIILLHFKKIGHLGWIYVVKSIERQRNRWPRHCSKILWDDGTFFSSKAAGDLFTKFLNNDIKMELKCVNSGIYINYNHFWSFKQIKSETNCSLRPILKFWWNLKFKLSISKMNLEAKKKMTFV